MRALAVWLLTVSTGPVVAQDPAPRVQPPVHELGMLCVGSVCEASTGIWWTDMERQPDPKTELPAGFRPLRENTRRFDQDEIVTELAFAVPTNAEGEFSKEIPIVRGDERAVVKVHWTVRKTPPRGSRILVAESPFETYSSDDPETFAAWRELVARARFDIDYRLRRANESPFAPEHLARVDIVLIGESSLTRLTNGDAARLQGFVCGGGRVVLCANAFFRDTVKGANRVCEPFGLKILDREPGGMATVTFEPVADHPLTVGIDSVVARRPSPIEIDGDRGQVLFGTDGLPFVGYTRTRSGGEVVTIGVSLWWKWLQEHPGNARLLRNLLVRPPRMR